MACDVWVVEEESKAAMPLTACWEEVSGSQRPSAEEEKLFEAARPLKALMTRAGESCVEEQEACANGQLAAFVPLPD